jgi:hypothetical protein
MQHLHQFVHCAVLLLHYAGDARTSSTIMRTAVQDQLSLLQQCDAHNNETDLFRTVRCLTNTSLEQCLSEWQSATTSLSTACDVLTVAQCIRIQQKSKTATNTCKVSEKLLPQP